MPTSSRRKHACIATRAAAVAATLVAGVGLTVLGGPASALTSVPTASPALSGVLPTLAPRPAGSLTDVYGVNVHIAGPTTPYGDTARLVGALTGLGVRHVRTSIFSNITEQWDSLRTLYANGIRANLVMGDPSRPTDPSTLVQVIKTQFPRGLVDSVEGANEWNLSGDPNWAVNDRAYQATLWSAVKGDSATASIPVLAPALGRRMGYSELGDLSAYSDVANAHMYSGGLAPDLGIDTVTAGAQTNVPGKPVVFTETGYHNAMNSNTGHIPTPEDVVGVYAPRLLLDHYSRGTQRVYDYELLDETADPAMVDPEQHFGLLRSDWSPKPAYTALQSLLRAVADPGPVTPLSPLDYQISGATPDLRQVLLQRHDGSYLLALWRDVSVYDRTSRVVTPPAPVTVTLGLGVRSTITVDDLSDGKDPVSAGTGDQIAVPVAGNVKLVSITPSPAPANEQPGPVNSIAAVPADSGAVVSWDSPQNGGQVSAYTLTATPGLGGQPVTVTVPSGARRALVPGMTNGQPWVVTVTPSGPAGYGPASLTVSVVPNAPPGSVATLSVRPRDTAELVSWAAPTAGGPVSGYTIMADHGAGSLSVVAPSTSALFPGLVNGTPYRFTVTATGPGGASAPSPLSLAVLPVAVPGAVGSLTGVAGLKSISLRWTPPATGGSTLSYTVTTDPATYPRTVAASSRTLVVNNLRSGVVYRVIITPNGVAGSGKSTATPGLTAK